MPPVSMRLTGRKRPSTPRRQVDPKMGYDEITWAEDAELIWGPDLEQSNTVLCRLTVE